VTAGVGGDSICGVKARSTIRWYQAASRAWLTAAVLSLLLPESDRLGLWLPLHLALAGAVSTAIAGAMQNFALTLTASPGPPAWLVGAQFAGVTAGAAMIAVGYPTGRTGLVAAGGTLFVAAAVLLGWFVLRAWRIGLNRRHRLPLAMYLAAVAAVVVGGGLGAIVGSRAVDDPQSWLALRQAHLTLNVLGWASLTIAGTLVTLLPTVLRVRMPNWHGTATGGALAGGLAVLATGLALRSAAVATVGGFAYAAGAIGVGWMAIAVLRTPRRWPVPVAAKHLLPALAWFVLGSVLLVVVLAGGSSSWLAFRRPFLAIFVLGWVLQTLLGAWQYLLPMARPGHPDDRRRQLAAIEFGAGVQVVALNAGVALLALAGAGWLGGVAGAIGSGLALAGGGIALVKAWAFGPLGRVPGVSTERREVWGE
jgi:nitrite reductase (NO-forming)